MNQPHFGFLNRLLKPISLVSVLHPLVLSWQTVSYLISFRHLSSLTLRSDPNQNLSLPSTLQSHLPT